MTQKHEPDGKNIEPGMVVEATKGDLGEEDVSKPKVSAVVQDQQGDFEKLLVHKGVIFKKTLEIPADRIQSVDEAHTDENTSGKVTVEVSKQEAASLTSVGEEAFASENQHGLLDQVEQEVPTAEGLRELEARTTATRAKRKLAQAADDEVMQRRDGAPSQTSGEDEQAEPTREKPSNFFFRMLGPGFYRKIMRNQRLGLMTNIGLMATALLMFTAAILLFYGLASGRGG